MPIEQNNFFGLMKKNRLKAFFGLSLLIIFILSFVFAENRANAQQYNPDCIAVMDDFVYDNNGFLINDASGNPYLEGNFNGVSGWVWDSTNKIWTSNDVYFSKFFPETNSATFAAYGFPGIVFAPSTVQYTKRVTDPNTPGYVSSDTDGNYITDTASYYVKYRLKFTCENHPPFTVTSGSDVRAGSPMYGSFGPFNVPFNAQGYTSYNPPSITVSFDDESWGDTFYSNPICIERDKTANYKGEWFVGRAANFSTINRLINETDLNVNGFYSPFDILGPVCSPGFAKEPNTVTPLFTPSDDPSVTVPVSPPKTDVAPENPGNTPGCTFCYPPPPTTVTPTPPSAPSGTPTVVPGSCGSGVVGITWNSVSGATGYNLYDNGVKVNQLGPITGSGSTISFSDSGLSAGSSHVYQVTALNSNGESLKSLSSSVNAPNICPPQAPTPPSSIIPGVCSSGSITISNWGRPVDATSYNIYRVGVTNPIDNTTGTSFTDTGLTPGVLYSYQVTAVNAGGESARSPIVSATAPSICIVPPNDNFPGQSISCGTITGSNINATKESGEPSHAGNAGGKSVWWSWRAPLSTTATISTIGSNFDTLLGIYTGSAVNALTIRASDDDSGGNKTSLANMNVVGGTIYRIAVDGLNGSSGNITLNISCPLPDFVSMGLTSGTYTVNTPIQFTGQIQNNGGDTNSTFNNRFRVTSGATTIFDSIVSLTSLNYGENKTISSSVWTPNVAGTYTLQLCADYNSSSVGTVQEMNDQSSGVNNNCSSTNLTITNVVTPPGSVQVSWSSSGTVPNAVLLGINMDQGNASFSNNPYTLSNIPVGSHHAYGLNISGYNLTARVGTGCSSTYTGCSFTSYTIPNSIPVPVPTPIAGTYSVMPFTVSSSGYTKVEFLYTQVVVPFDYDVNVNSPTISMPAGTIQSNSASVVLTTPPPVTPRSVTVNITKPAGAPNITPSTFTCSPPSSDCIKNLLIDTTGVTPGNYTITVSGSTSDDNASNNTVTFVVSVTPGCNPSNDNFSGTAISSCGTIVYSNNSCATKESSEPNHAGNPGGKSVWWNFTAPTSYNATFETVGSSFDTVLGVYTGNFVSGLTQRGGDDDSGGGGTSKVSVSLTAGTNYKIAVDGFNGAYGNVQLKVSCTLPDLTAVVNNPSSIIANSSVVFTGSVANSGGDVTGPFFNHFKLTNTSTNSVTHLNPDPLLSGILGGTTVSVVSPAWIASPGTYNLALCADETQTGGSASGSVVESNEFNNCSTPATFTVSPLTVPPDLSSVLSVSGTSIPGSVNEFLSGSTLVFNVDVLNSPNTSNVSRTFSNAIQYSVNGPGGPFVDAYAIPMVGINSGQTKSFSQNHLTGNTGTFYIRSFADISNTVTESNVSGTGEANNFSSAVPITIVSDISGISGCSVTPQNLNTGQSSTWSVSGAPSGGYGAGTYSYSWAGHYELSGVTGLSVNRTYNTAGSFPGSVTVRSTSGSKAISKTFSCGSVNVSASLPDLVPLGLSNRTVTVGTPVTFSGSIRNDGVATALSFSNHFRLTGVATYDLVGSQVSGGLAYGASAPVSASWTPTVAGSYTLRLCADQNASGVGAVSESNELNNCTTATVTVTSSAQPNITATNLSLVGGTKIYLALGNEYAAGVPISLSASINNIGPANVSTTFQNQFKSYSSNLGSSISLTGLSANTSNSILSSPVNFVQGTYSLDVCADSTNVVTNESSEGDNCLTTPLVLGVYNTGSVRVSYSFSSGSGAVLTGLDLDNPLAVSASNSIRDFSAVTATSHKAYATPVSNYTVSASVRDCSTSSYLTCTTYTTLSMFDSSVPSGYKYVNFNVLNGRYNQVHFTYSPVTVAGGDIKVKRVGSDDTVNTVAPNTASSVDTPITPNNFSNPSDFTNVSLGNHVVYVTDSPGYTESFGICSYVRGSSECVVSTFSPATCNGSTCQTTTSVSSGNVSKVVFKYVASIISSPTVDLTVNGNQAPSGSPINVNSGQNLNLTWTSSNLSSENACTASGSGGWSGNKVNSGSQNVQAPNTAGIYQYTLSCSGLSGTPATDSVYVRVNTSIPPPASVGASKDLCGTGVIIINWGPPVSGATEYRIYDVKSTPSLVGTTSASSVPNFRHGGLSPDSPHEYYVTAFGNGVESAPSVSAIENAPSTCSYSGKPDLRPVGVNVDFSGATKVVLGNTNEYAAPFSLISFFASVINEGSGVVPVNTGSAYVMDLLDINNPLNKGCTLTNSSSCKTIVDGNLTIGSLYDLLNMGPGQVRNQSNVNWTPLIGKYDLNYCVDLGDLGRSNGYVSELNETNNCIFASQFSVVDTASVRLRNYFPDRDFAGIWYNQAYYPAGLRAGIALEKAGPFGYYTNFGSSVSGSPSNETRSTTINGVKMGQYFAYTSSASGYSVVARYRQCSRDWNTSTNDFNSETCGPWYPNDSTYLPTDTVNIGGENMHRVYINVNSRSTGHYQDRDITDVQFVYKPVSCNINGKQTESIPLGGSANLNLVGAETPMTGTLNQNSYSIRLSSCSYTTTPPGSVNSVGIPFTRTIVVSPSQNTTYNYSCTVSFRNEWTNTPYNIYLGDSCNLNVGYPGITNLSATPGLCGTNGMTLNWTAVTAPSGRSVNNYEVYERNDTNGSFYINNIRYNRIAIVNRSGNRTDYSHSFTTSNHNTPYSYIVKTVFDNNASSTSNIVNVTSPNLCSFGAPPISCSVSQSSGVKTGSNITWTATVNSMSYPNTPTFTYKWEGSERAPLTNTSTSFTNTLSTNYALVGTRNMTLNITDSYGRTVNPVCPAVTTVTTPPATFTATSGVCATGSISLLWTAPSGVGLSTVYGYRIYRRPSSGGADVLIYQTPSSSSGTYLDNDKRNADMSINTDGTGTPNKLPERASYIYTIKALYSSVGSSAGVYTESSGLTSSATSPSDVCSSPPPEQVTASAGYCDATGSQLKPTEIKVDWVAPTSGGSVDNYIIFVDGSSSGITLNANQTDYTHAGLSPGTNHSYKVRSVRGGIASSDVFVTAQTPTCTGSGDLCPFFNLTPALNPVSYDSSTNLSWNSSNASSCNVIGPNVNSSGLSGSVSTGNLKGDSFYTINCYNPSCTSSQVITVQVTPTQTPPAVFDLNVSCALVPGIPKVGEEVEFTATVSNGSQPFTYVWTEKDSSATGANTIVSVTNSGISSNQNSFRKIFTTVGNKYVDVRVTSADGKVGICNPPLGVKVVASPTFEEF